MGRAGRAWPGPRPPALIHLPANEKETVGHSHTHNTEDVSGARLFITMMLNFVIAAAEIVGGLISGSLALLSDAIHSFSDGISLVISHVAIRLRSRPSSARHTFGFKRAEVFAAVINSAALVVITVYLFIEAIKRFITPAPIHGQIMLVVAGIGLAANVIGTLLLRRGAKASMNIKAAYLHLFADAISSVGVILGGVAIYLWNVYWLDPVITILIGVYILKEAYEIIKETAHILMEGVPGDVCIDKIGTAIEGIPGGRDIHHVHAWSVGEHDNHLEAHIGVDDMMVSKADEIRAQAEEILREKFHIGHVTLQIENACCSDTGLIKQQSHA